MKITNEHVWPAWFYELFSPKTISYENEETIKPLRTWTERVTPKSRPGIKVNRVGECCNVGWMSALESRAKPILAPMMMGRSWSLTSESRDIVATWIVKTFMVLELTRSGPSPVVFRAEDRLTFSRTLKPPPGTVIWIAGFAGTLHGFFRSAHPEMHLEVSDPTTIAPGLGPMNSFAGPTTLGRLAIQMLWLGADFQEHGTPRLQEHSPPGPFRVTGCF